MALCGLGPMAPSSIVAFTNALLHNRNPEDAAYDSYHNYPNYGATEERAVIRYLQEPGNREGAVELLSYTPALRMHLDRTFVGVYSIPSVLALHASDATANHNIRRIRKSGNVRISILSAQPSHDS